MVRDFRIVRNGVAVNFSCSNTKYCTNLRKGHKHGSRQSARGSVLEVPLVVKDGYSLWLEYVKERKTGKEYYWLMWYDPSGRPTIPLSGVFAKRELRRMEDILRESFNRQR